MDFKALIETLRSPLGREKTESKLEMLYFVYEWIIETVASMEMTSKNFATDFFLPWMNVLLTHWPSLDPVLFILSNPTVIHILFIILASACVFVIVVVYRAVLQAIGRALHRHIIQSIEQERLPSSSGRIRCLYFLKRANDVFTLPPRKRYKGPHPFLDYNGEFILPFQLR